MPPQPALLCLGRQHEQQSSASSLAAWLGQLFFERLPWVAGDLLAEVQVIGHSVTRSSVTVILVRSQLDQHALQPLHSRHHRRSGVPLSWAGPEAEPQARPERAARIMRSRGAHVSSVTS